MHISLVSPSRENIPCFELLQSLDHVTIKRVATVDALVDKNVTMGLVFFDAKVGEKSIFQQVHLYQKQNKQLKWMVIHLSDVHQSLHYIQAGASGILINLCDKEKLQHSIQLVSNGQLYLDEELIQILAMRQIKKILHPFSELTAREFDVFCLLAENYSIQTISEVLSITIKTAFNCQTQLRKKLNIKNQQQLIILANNYSLIFKKMSKIPKK